MKEADPFRILTVCLGNVCRSPLAERLFRVKLEAAAWPGRIEVSSAGVIGMVGRPMEPRAAVQLARLGGDPDGFVARRLDPAQVTAADLVLTATVDVRRQVLKLAPGSLRQAFTLREFATLCESADPAIWGDPVALVAHAVARRTSVRSSSLDIKDPMGGSERTHARVADQVDEAVRTIVSRLAPSGGDDG
jgi:protein-tyrosine phosphatase